MNKLIIFAKYPEPGKVKTRLAKDLGDIEAARIYSFITQRIIERTLDPDNYNTIIFYDPADKEREIKQWIDIEDIRYLPQLGSTLGDRISDAFEKVYFITGNHDLYYRDKRELNSIEYARDLPNFVMVDDHFLQDDVAIIPWLVGTEYKEVAKMQCKYMFGHFELPYFKMNAMVEMPDHNGIKAEMLCGPEYVFSGHFHKRQNKGNIWYLGSPFPHNYADAWDDERGMMILEWGGKPQFIDWPDMPRYRTIKLSKLLEDPGKYLNNKTYARVTLDINITYEEATFIKEEFAKTYGLREISLMPQMKEEHATEWAQQGDVVFESVDQIVISQIQNIESEVIDKKMLVDIYEQLSG